MPVKSVIIERSVRKRLPKLPLYIHERIIDAINDLSFNPLKGVKLHGELSEYYKLRIGDYRIIYQFDSEKSRIIIVKVEHRQGVYK
ncbi:hypothetical protein A3D78_01870 [Candidatus Gottesmanbacteria bacterium RIFCSPHIGHO2_02_FULL_39_14]|uniref:Addiction module antitoxin RelB n=2 Tax=Candidatus Gottesmaniibacteriota TaxID=1752720 RepID=A0A1F6A1V3_9BACT|nr:MAG: hypothetical protein A2153_03205 [Candidatus Gottesmanbacteria bacterium RBG_16_38_7b]OGG18544.1 MAG: hypothetical protein A3D78_01870 [Candidatus Gottesmanbacteria bacterium RIFCSPHIGHO2_02_FULL_39_14]